MASAQTPIWVEVTSVDYRIPQRIVGKMRFVFHISTYGKSTSIINTWANVNDFDQLAVNRHQNSIQDES